MFCWELVYVVASGPLVEIWFYTHYMDIFLVEWFERDNRRIYTKHIGMGPTTTILIPYET